MDIVRDVTDLARCDHGPGPRSAFVDTENLPAYLAAIAKARQLFKETHPDDGRGWTPDGTHLVVELPLREYLPARHFFASNYHIPSESDEWFRCEGFIFQLVVDGCLPSDAVKAKSELLECVP